MAAADDDSEDDFAPGPPIIKGSVPEKPAPEIVPKDPKKRRVIEDDGLSIQLKLDAIEAQAPKALLATPQRR